MRIAQDITMDAYHGGKPVIFTIKPFHGKKIVLKMEPKLVRRMRDCLTQVIEISEKPITK